MDFNGQTLMVVKRIAEISESKGMNQDQKRTAARRSANLLTGQESHIAERRNPNERSELSLRCMQPCRRSSCDGRRVDGGWLGTRFPSGSYRTEGTESSWIVTERG